MYEFMLSLCWDEIYEWQSDSIQIRYVPPTPAGSSWTHSDNARSAGQQQRDLILEVYAKLAMAYSARPWIAVFVLPDIINDFQHGGDQERSGPRSLKKCP